MSGFTNEFAAGSGSVTAHAWRILVSRWCNQTTRANELGVHGPADGIARLDSRLLR